MAGYGFNTRYGFDNGPPPPYAYPGFGVPQYPGCYQPQPYGMQQPPMYQPYGQPYGQPYAPTMPAIPPIQDHGVPGVNIKNHLNGLGTPPGITPIFSKRYTLVHIFHTDTKPWQATNAQQAGGFTMHYAPVEMTVKEFMQQIGCNNDDPKKNVLIELTEMGGGRWATGLKINGDDKDRVKKTLGDFGWDEKRTGNLMKPGDKPIVWLWRTNKGM